MRDLRRLLILSTLTISVCLLTLSGCASTPAVVPCPKVAPFPPQIMEPVPPSFSDRVNKYLLNLRERLTG